MKKDKALLVVLEMAEELIDALPPEKDLPDWRILQADMERKAIRIIKAELDNS